MVRNTILAGILKWFLPVILVTIAIGWTAENPTVGLIAILLAIEVALRWRQGWRPWERRAPGTDALLARLERVRYMSGTEFEHLTADVFAALGYGTRVLGGSGDQGVDVIAEGTRNGLREKFAIQCKQYDKPFGNAPVQQVLAGMIHHGCTKGVVVAPMGFTRGAKELANSVGVELHDAFSLRTWIMRETAGTARPLASDSRARALLT